MLTIEVKLNGEVIAKATVVNDSHLADESAYRCRWHELPCPQLGIEAKAGSFVIERHNRRQTAWALVAKVVARVLDSYFDPRVR